MRSETLLRLNRMLGSSRLKFAAVLTADCIGARHLIVRFDPIMACNLRCGMCYFSDEQFLPPGPVRRFSKADVDRIAELFFPLALQLHIGCGTEPTMYKAHASIVEIARRYKVPFVGFTTNAQLLTEPNLRTMIAAGLSEITVSAHGVTKETYERLMQGASFEQFHEKLRMLVALKKSLGSTTPRLRINYTVNSSNLEELRHFFDRFDEYGVATLQIRPMDNIGNTAYRWEDMSQHADAYNDIIALLMRQCGQRGIHLLANALDPRTVNAPATVYENAVLRVINPNFVWHPDFDFRKTTYREYLSRTGYRRKLLRYVVRGDKSLLRNTRLGSAQVLR